MKTSSFNRRQFIGWSTAGLVTAGLAACAAPTPSPNTGAGLDQISLILDWIPKGQTSPFYLALDKGFYAESGLAVQISRGYGSGDTSLRIANGDADFGFAAVQSVMDTIAQGLDLWEVAPLLNTDPSSVFSTKAAGIHDAQSMIGKRGAVDAGDSIDTLFRAWVAANGLDYDTDFDWLFIDGAGVAQIQADQADFVMDWGVNVPEWWLLDPPIEAELLTFGKDLGIYGNWIIARTETVESDPDLAARFVEATLRGYKYVAEGGLEAHEESVGALLKYNPELEAQPNAREFHLGNLQCMLACIATENAAENGLGVFDESRVTTTLDYVNEWLLDAPLERDQAFNPTQLIEKGQIPIDFEKASASIAEVLGRPNPML